MDSENEKTLQRLFAKMQAVGDISDIGCYALSRDEFHAVQALRKSRDGWKDEAESLRGRLKSADQQLQLARDKLESDVWIWQNDGNDHLSSMGSRMTVLIAARHLRELIANRSELAGRCGYAVFGSEGGKTHRMTGYFGETISEVKQQVLVRARKEGYTGDIDARMLELGWWVEPVYRAAPQQHGQEVEYTCSECVYRGGLNARGACPLCGFKPKPQQSAEAVAEYQYRNPGANDDSWHRMTQEEYEASLATGHCCGIASWTKNFELRKLYTTPNPAQKAEVAAVDFDGTDSEVLREFIRLCREVKPVGQWPGERVCAAIERFMLNENQQPAEAVAEEPTWGDADERAYETWLRGTFISEKFLRQQISAICTVLENGEWANLLLQDPDIARLDSAISSMLNRSSPPPAIDIGKLRELAKWMRARADGGWTGKHQPVSASTLRVWARTIEAALIGAGGENFS